MRAHKPKNTALHASLDRLMYKIHNYHQGETRRGLNKKTKTKHKTGE